MTRGVTARRGVAKEWGGDLGRIIHFRVTRIFFVRIVAYVPIACTKARAGRVKSGFRLYHGYPSFKFKGIRSALQIFAKAAEGIRFGVTKLENNVG